MVEIYCMDIQEIKMSILDSEKILSAISSKKRTRVCSTQNPNHYIPSIIADLLVIKGVRDITGKTIKNVQYSYNEYGKPFLNPEIGVHFNITHSERFVIVAFSHYNIGIDIEKIRDINLKIVDQIFSAQEQEFLENVPQIKRLNYFYLIWTLKESYIKALGKGLSIPLQTFSVANKDHLFDCVGNEFSLISDMINKEYYLGLSINRNERKYCFHKTKIEELLMIIA